MYVYVACPSLDERIVSFPYVGLHALLLPVSTSAPKTFGRSTEETNESQINILISYVRRH